MKRKTTLWIGVAVAILAVLLIMVFGRQLKPTQRNDETICYQNPILRIKFDFNSEWKAKKSGLIQGYPTQYAGEDGFFVVNAIPKENSLIETVRNIISEDQGFYGAKPLVEELIVNSRVGYFIYPDPQFEISEQHPACYVTELNSPAYYNGNTCSVLLIYSNKEDLSKIVQSLEPYYPSQQ
ncbi:MAG: hypothetical protein KAH01_08690 [Caldisericia bacterium]|nr:hypothetical protein [Caldisericia bacterium]